MGSKAGRRAKYARACARLAWASWMAAAPAALGAGSRLLPRASVADKAHYVTVVRCNSTALSAALRLPPRVRLSDLQGLSPDHRPLLPRHCRQRLFLPGGVIPHPYHTGRGLAAAARG